MKTYPPSQEEVLIGFLKALNSDRNANYEVVDRPDEVERTRPEVDYVLRDPRRPSEIAVEVSSTWRSENAGKEDADWAKWTERVRQEARRYLLGQFRVATPMSIPPNICPKDFADKLVDVVESERAGLESLHRQAKGKHFNVAGLRVFISFAFSDGNDVSWGRLLSDDKDSRELPGHWNRVLEKKSHKLRAHKDAGRETWLVAYNTFWTSTSPVQLQDMILRTLGTEHQHIDHVGIVAGNPPDDAWLDVIR